MTCIKNQFLRLENISYIYINDLSKFGNMQNMNIKITFLGNLSHLEMFMSVYIYGDLQNNLEFLKHMNLIKLIMPKVKQYIVKIIVTRLSR